MVVTLQRENTVMEMPSLRQSCTEAVHQWVIMFSKEVTMKKRNNFSSVLPGVRQKRGREKEKDEKSNPSPSKMTLKCYCLHFNTCDRIFKIICIYRQIVLIQFYTSWTLLAKLTYTFIISEILFPLKPFTNFIS